MKKLLLVTTIMIAFAGTLFAKPLIHIGADVGIGRARKGCEGAWLCIKITDVGPAHVVQGGPTNGHALVMNDDGTLSIAVDMDLLRIQDPEKFETLNTSNSIYLDSPETLPDTWLQALGFEGQNNFPAGQYIVIREGKYAMIQIHN